jgi:hypothetical protein
MAGCRSQVLGRDNCRCRRALEYGN